ncbi:phage tail protein [Streptomyces sp. ISL-112]|uniref:phage tail tube protein n=1 Tax=unclassified Streptomyces TaxID=2593676 RepID=UPI001BEB2949|nr:MULTISPECIES: phage tail protein [unclassified Streptomyces]MBT2425124.1 phage tail protein [Streptomyces sp. ISL-112]MBT2464874.1 phage tail protein [Streptomyces sp. ISL-63]
MGDSANIIVGTAGKAYAAPVGTTFPTGPEVAWPAGFADMGFITPDGLEEALAEERTQLDAWGEDAPVVDLAKKRTQTFKLVFRETTAQLLSLYYQVQMDNMTSTPAVTEPAEKQFLSFGSGSTQDTVEIALGLDVIYGGKRHRIMIARCGVSDRGARKHSADDSSNYELTFTALSAPGGAQSVQHMITEVTLPA